MRRKTLLGLALGYRTCLIEPVTSLTLDLFRRCWPHSIAFISHS
jgi:hypothetical protein